MRAEGSTIVVTHRLPVTMERHHSIPSCLRPAGSGLVRALDSVLLGSNGGAWIGCAKAENADAIGEGVESWRANHSYPVAPVYLSREERADYERFSNEVIWPLFHGLPIRQSPTADCWSGYCRVNGRIGEAVQDINSKDALVWVHDYQLMMVASLLRANGWRRRIGYFHHIPFPPPDVLERLPWRFDVLLALLQFDLIGFQTDRDQRNFVASLEECLPIAGPHQVGGKTIVRVLNREVRLGAYPVGINSEEFSRKAADPFTLAAATAIRTYTRDAKVVLSVDRLDCTKGILERMAAFRKLLEKRPEMRERVAMVQIVIPDNEDIRGRSELQLQIETSVAQINEEYGTPQWAPIHYYHRRLTEAQLIAFYRAAHVAMITPLRDGMNLAAKEFCACRRDERGVLVLSEFAGAAEELKVGALLVNPHDVDRVASVLHYALRMNECEQQERMSALRARIRTHDVFNWSRSFHADAALLNLVPGHSAATLPVPADAAEEPA